MIHQPWALLIQRCFELITYTFRSIYLCLFHMQYRGFFFLPSANRFLASWPSVTILMLRGDIWKQTIGRLGPQHTHTHTQKLYLLCLFLNISDSLKATFPIGGRCSSSKKKRGKSNDQKSSGSVTVQIPLLCIVPTVCYVTVLHYLLGNGGSLPLPHHHLSDGSANQNSPHEKNLVCKPSLAQGSKKQCCYGSWLSWRKEQLNFCRHKAQHEDTWPQKRSPLRRANSLLFLWEKSLTS